MIGFKWASVAVMLLSLLFADHEQQFINNGSFGGAGEWKLVWSDEFDGDRLNMQNWTYDVGGNGWGNNELEYYTWGDNVQVKDGILSITARRETRKNREYTSARIKTQKKVSFLKGRVEARIKLPQGKGAWPAFWMMGNANGGQWPYCGEIDIMEAFHQCDVARGSLFLPQKGAGDRAIWEKLLESYAKDIPIPDRDDWHVYAFEWNGVTMKWYLDDVCYQTVRMKLTEEWKCFWQPYYLLLNLALSGKPNKNELPMTMQVDYVRAYTWQKAE